MDTRRLDTEADRRKRVPDAQRSAAALPHVAHEGPLDGRGPGPGRVRAPDARGPRGPRPRRHRRLAPSRRPQPRDEPWAEDLRRRTPALRARRIRLGTLAGEPDRGRRGAAGRGRRRSRTSASSIARHSSSRRTGTAGPRSPARSVEREVATRTLLCRARAKVRAHGCWPASPAFALTLERRPAPAIAIIGGQWSIVSIGERSSVVAPRRRALRPRSMRPPPVAGPRSSSAARLASARAGWSGALAATARDRGATVLGGACLPAGSGAIPYAPFVEALREPDPVRRARLAGGACSGRHGTRSRACSPRSASADATTSPRGPNSTARDRRGCSRPCSASSSARPAAGPWCSSSRTSSGPTTGRAGSSASCRAICAECRSCCSPRSGPVSSIGGIRPWRSSPNWSGMHGSPDSISAASTGTRSLVLLRELAAAAPSAATVDDVMDRSGGNPFFVEQLAATFERRRHGRDAPAGTARRARRSPCGPSARNPAGTPGGVGRRAPR